MFVDISVSFYDCLNVSNSKTFCGVIIWTAVDCPGKRLIVGFNSVNKKKKYPENLIEECQQLAEAFVTLFGRPP